MKEQPKSKGGRPPGRTYPKMMMLRCQPEWLQSIDEWCEQQPDKPPRAVAIRQLVDHGIKTWGKRR